MQNESFEDQCPKCQGLIEDIQGIFNNYMGSDTFQFKCPLCHSNLTGFKEVVVHHRIRA